MEDKKVNIIVILIILFFFFVIIVVCVYLKFFKFFYFFVGVDIFLIFVVFCFFVIWSCYNRERKNFELRYILEGREFRIEYSFFWKVVGVLIKFKFEDFEEVIDGFRV